MNPKGGVVGFANNAAIFFLRGGIENAWLFLQAETLPWL
jgi:hypothetical protein